MEGRTEDPKHRPIAALLLTGGTIALLGVALAAVPREHAPLPAIARQAMETALPYWKLTEPVNGVVYGSRGFDTFGETFLLLAAVISVVVLTRSKESRTGYFGEVRAAMREQAEEDPDAPIDRSEQEARQAERDEREGRERSERMTVVVRTAVRTAAPVLAVAGTYLVAWGFSPGGGFPAGAAIVGVLLLVYAAFGRRLIAKVVRPGLLETIELVGAAAIIGIQVMGLLLRGSLGANWLPLTAPQTIRSGGVVQAFSVAEFVEVGTGLAIVIFALLATGRDWTPDKDKQDEQDEHSRPGEERQR